MNATEILIRHRFAGLLGALAGLLLPGSAPAGWAAESAAAGTIAGSVSNVATRTLLAGATVEVPELGLSILTDATGHYELRGVRPGRHTVRATYPGLDPDGQSVAVPAGGRVDHHIGLRSEIYALDRFTVVGEREGYAAAITDQRNAESIRVTASLDAFGNLFNNELGELAVRLPGIAGLVADEGFVQRAHIRGSDSLLNTTTIDGFRMPSTGEMTRQFTLNELPSGFFENMELTKALTPDIGADSLGGTINLSTRSAARMREKRSFELEATAKWAAPFYDHTPRSRDKPLHGFGAFTYRERFRVPGGDRTLAVLLNLAYRENATEVHNENVNYQASTNAAVPLTATNIYEMANNRKTQGVLLRVDYALSPRTKFHASYLYKDGYEPSLRYWRFGTANAATVAALDASGQPTGTGAVLPGFTATRTEVRPLASSTATLTVEGNRFRNVQARSAVGLEHKRGDLTVDLTAVHATSRTELRHEESGGLFSLTMTGVGFVQETVGDRGVAWRQTAGPSVLALGSYPTNLLNQKNNRRIHTIDGIGCNGAYTLEARTRTFLKAGARISSEFAQIKGGDRQWTYVGPDGVAGRNPATGRNDDDVSVFVVPGQNNAALGQAFPFVEVEKVAADRQAHPERWVEDLYYGRTRNFIGSSSAREQVNSAYVMGGTTWRQRLRLMGGLRREEVRVRASNYVPASPLATAAQIPDPVRRAEHDRGNPRRNYGRYGQNFPGAFLTYNFTRNLLGRASWTTSIGRPSFSSLVPSETVNATAETVTLGNPSLLPQRAKNLDLSLEYYYEPAGVVSVGVFEKKIRDFIASATTGVVPAGADNGFSGNYAGYDIIQNRNAGTATVRGLEFNYRQELTFLPGRWKGLGLTANYCRILTEGDYGTPGTRSTSLLPSFVPTSGNAGISYRLNRLSARVLWNHASDYLLTYSAAAASLTYMRARQTVNASLNFTLRPGVRVFLDGANLLNEPTRRYRYVRTRFQLASFSGTWINAGVKTQF
jgi:iron complex outermembrane receptor protein